MLSLSPEIMDTSVGRELEVTPEIGFVPGCSDGIQALNNTIGEIAGTDIPVLLQGDSGTGKEVYARLIYRLSAQSRTPLTKISCTILDPGQLLAAVRRTTEAAADLALDKGVALFLDAVDELSLDCQRVLLSLVEEEESEFGTRKRLRLISTTTRNLESEIRSGHFRRELYFRIAGVFLRLPSLRERKEDIPALLEYFLEKHAAEMGRKTPVLDAKELELLINYDWPGNVRELGNLARKIAALGDSKSTVAELKGPATVRNKKTDAPTNLSLKNVAKTASRLAERDLILKALERTHWNRKRAARELQISYKALLYKIKQMNVAEDGFLS